MTSTAVLTALMINALMLTACGTDDGAATTTAAVPTTSTTEPSPTTAEATTTTSGPTTTVEPILPGEPIEFGPTDGEVVAVIGVAHDDVLNLRQRPGADQDIVGEIPPLEDGLVALGRTRDLGDAFWIAVDFRGASGWVHFGFIGYLGNTTDETVTIVEDMGETPVAGTMEDLGRVVAESLASSEPPSDIVMTTEPTVGDLGEVTYDVVGLGDDAVRGLRVHVLGQAGDAGFSLRSVEVTLLCGRGVSVGGTCI